ncbi:MAG: hypothetical protein GXP31_12530 [Kiritimatiellaeota bacterium]|nr:hypothetical protein [Kiritimatiellota bacterium]
MQRDLKPFWMSWIAVGAIVAGATRAATERPQFSAWYRFETPEAPGRSTGLTPWPATTRDVRRLPRGAGRFGGAIRLPGTRGNGLYLPNPVAFFGKTARTGTIALWAKASDPPGPKPRILFDFMVSSRNTLVDGYETVMFVQADKLVTWPALGRRMELPSPLAAGQWVHLALAWDCMAGATLYVNGKKAVERKGRFKPTPLSPVWPGRIGSHTVGGGYAFAGDIDELRLFNRRLTDGEVAALHALDPTIPAVAALLQDDGTVDVLNRTSGRVTIRFDRWLPSRTLAPPWYGYTPAAFNQTVWTAGMSTTEPLGPQQIVPPDGSVSRRLDFPHDCWGPGRLRIMVGAGLALQELPVTPLKRRWFFRRTAGAPQFGLLDRRGLAVEVLRTKPVVFSTGRDLSLPIRIGSDLKRRARGTLGFVVSGPGPDGKECGSRSVPVDLQPGKSRRLELTFPGLRLEPARYELRVTFIPASGEHGIPLQRLPVFGCSDDTLSTICAPGAAYVGNPMDDHVLARMAADGVKVVRFGAKKDGASFRRALEAVLAHGMRVWHTPVFSYSQVCADPAKRATLERWASEFGKGLRDNRAVIDQSMAGEGLSYPPCYCEHCTSAFRNWLRRKYGSIVELNRAWGSRYTTWDEVEQLGSPADVDMAAERLKMMQVALELPKRNTDRWKRLFELDKPRAMAWRRWHDELLLDWYRDFASAFRRANGGTVPLSEQPCWPNFKTHVFFPLAKIADAGGMDLYLPGEMKTTLGYAAELFLNFDMNASVYANERKPVMVHELYVQDLSPPGLAEAQGWWLVGRGYNLMTFFTYNYYHEGTRAGLPLVFGLFDKDWRPYPAYASFKRFVADLARFRERVRVPELRRVEPRIGQFLGDDVSIANILETGGSTWEAIGVKGHNGSYWLTERNGFGVEFIGDGMFDRLDRERVLVVPWCHVIRPAAVGRILDVARGGGLVVIDGAFAQFDGVYRAYPVVPGGGAAEALGVRCTGFDRNAARIVLPDGRKLEARGRPRGLVLEKRVRVLGRYEDGGPAVVESAVGKGRVIWLLSALGPEHRSRAPDPNAVRFWGGLIARAGLAPRSRFEPDAAGGLRSDSKTLDHGGKGIADSAPLPDVSCRVRRDRDLFVFAANFFAPSRGQVRLALPERAFTVSDALTGKPVRGAWHGRTLSIPLELGAFDGRVFELRYTGARKAPLADW